MFPSLVEELRRIKEKGENGNPSTPKVFDILDLFLSFPLIDHWFSPKYVCI
jgi:hypothetical protein